MPNPSSLDALTEDSFVTQLINENTAVNVFLISGIRLSGVITGHDQQCIYLSGTLPQMVYKKAIATILPQP